MPRGDVFQVDERIAPDGDDDRNLTHMLDHLPDPAIERLHPMPVTEDDLDAAARRYEALLPEALDVVHLGLGPTATPLRSCPAIPCSTSPTAVSRCTVGEYQGRRRMTLTYPALAAARQVLWLVDAGRDDVVARLLAHEPSIPAGCVDAPDALMITVGGRPAQGD